MERFLQKAVVRQLVLLSHEGRSWTKDPTHPRPFMNIEEFWTELYALSFML